MLLFRSEEHVDHWCRQRSLARGASMSLDTAWNLAQVWFGMDRRERGWRRRTVDEIETIFEGLGLTGEFWALR